MEISKVREELAEKVKNIDPIENKIKLDIDGEFILIDGSEGSNIVTHKNEEADCTITMSLDTFLKLQRKEMKPMIATLKGKLKVEGDFSLAKKLKQLI